MKKHTGRWHFLGILALAAVVLQPGGRGGGSAEAAGPGLDPAPLAAALPAGAQTATRTLVVNLGAGPVRTSLPQPISSGHAAADRAAGLAELGYAVLPVPEDQAAAYRTALLQTPGVLSVETAQPVSTADTIPNDPQWSRQYGPSGIQAPKAWDTTTGSSTVVIAIIDTGLDLGHPDLAGKIWTNPGEIAGNGQDDDQNSYIDDVHGWDWYNGDNDPSDDHSPGHGTHVAGIAAAASNNSVGIAGVAWNVRLMPLKVLGGDGNGSDWAVAEAITYAAKHGARVINLSLAGHGLGSYVEAAIDFATSKGALVVAAAGNEGSAGLMQPAAFANVIGVIATDENNNRAGYSNYGSEADMAAPGHNILSTVRGGYGYMSGTSMAAPHVAGAAALLASLPEFDTVDKIQTALQLTAAEGGSPGWDAYYGWGRIQVANALAVELPAPSLCSQPNCWHVFLPVIKP